MMYIFSTLCESLSVALLFAKAAPDTAAAAAEVLVSAALCGFMIFFDDRKAVAAFAALNFACCFLNAGFVFFFAPVLFFSAQKKEFVSPALSAAALIIFSEFSANLTGALVCACALCYTLGFAYDYGARNYKNALSARDAGAQQKMLLERRNKDLEKAMAIEAERASLKERERIAEQMHDNAGHLLARSILMTGALRASAADSNEKEGLSELEDTLKEAMSQIRASVHKLKEEAVDLNRTAKSCAAGFPNFECGIKISVSKDVPSDIKYILASAMRECFSNAARHSNAKKIDLIIEEHPAFYKMIFKDDGGAKDDFKPGMGLNSIAERARAAGGRANFFVKDGFSVHIMLPKEKT